MNKAKGVIPAVSRTFLMKADIWMDVSKYQEHSCGGEGEHCVGAASSTVSGCHG